QVAGTADDARDGQDAGIDLDRAGHGQGDVAALTVVGGGYWIGTEEVLQRTTREDGDRRFVHSSSGELELERRSRSHHSGPGACTCAFLDVYSSTGDDDLAGIGIGVCQRQRPGPRLGPGDGTAGVNAGKDRRGGVGDAEGGVQTAGSGRDS